MPADLVGAKYPLNNPMNSLFGGLSNVNQADIPAFTNANYSLLGNPTDGALAATGIAAIVACPVDPGTVISKVSLLIGATAGATITHGFVALYAGTGTAPALIGQSTDVGTVAAITASTLYAQALTTPALITNALAPQNFVYVAIAITGTTIPTAVSLASPTGVNYQYNGTASPLFLSMTAGSALAGTAAATIASASAKAVAPVVLLT